MKNKALALLIGITCAQVFATKLSDTVLLVTIPKCGTHLLIKTIKLMTKKMVYYLGDMGMPRILTKAGLQQSLKNNKPYVHGHLPASKNNMDLTAHHKLKVIFIYRDPRDQVVSLKYHNQGNAPPFGHRGRDLDKMIPRVTSFFSEFLQWQNHPCVYTTKFESLVGSKGG